MFAGQVFFLALSISIISLSSFSPFLWNAFEQILLEMATEFPHSFSGSVASEIFEFPFLDLAEYLLALKDQLAEMFDLCDGILALVAA